MTSYTAVSDTIDMSGFDALTGSLEDYVNTQGFTMGTEAEKLQKLLFSIQCCYLHGVLTDKQAQEAGKKFKKQFLKALKHL